MATPMEYDTLREIYSSIRASLLRLRTKYNIDIKQFENDKNKFAQVWLNEIERKNLEDINYHTAALNLKEAAKSWITIEDELSA